MTRKAQNTSLRVRSIVPNLRTGNTGTSIHSRVSDNPVIQHRAQQETAHASVNIARECVQRKRKVYVSKRNNKSVPQSTIPSRHRIEGVINNGSSSSSSSSSGN